MNTWATDVETKNKEGKKKYRAECIKAAKDKSNKIKKKLLSNGVKDKNFCYVRLRDDIYPFVKETVQKEGYIIERISNMRIMGCTKYIIILNPTRWQVIEHDHKRIG